MFAVKVRDRSGSKNHQSCFEMTVSHELRGKPAGHELQPVGMNQRYITEG